MLPESLRALHARPRTLIAGVAMVIIAVTAMILIPTLTSAASRKVLADLNALGSNAWIAAPRQLPNGPPALIPDGGLARVSDLPGVLSALRVVTTTQQVRPNRQDPFPGSVTLAGIDATPGAPAVDTSVGVYRPVPGYRFALIGVSAAATLGMQTFPVTVLVQDIPIVITGVLQGDPLLPALDNAVVTDAATALSLDPASTDQVVIRETGGLRPNQIADALDPLARTPMAIGQPEALVVARTQSTTTLTGLAIAATAVAFGIAVLGITIMLTSSVRQRTAELAVRRVHGARARSIAALISAEALLIGLVGGLLGLLTANLTAAAVIAARHWPPTADWHLQIAALAAALAMCLVASLPPAILAIRIQPARAFAVE